MWRHGFTSLFVIGMGACGLADTRPVETMPSSIEVAHAFDANLPHGTKPISDGSTVDEADNVYITSI